jgi:predicted nucleic acid-binding protein
MSRVFVVDTNVVVAGLITGNVDSPVARTLDGMLGRAFVCAISETLLAEYRRVLLRSHIRARHRLAEHEVDALLTGIAKCAIVLQPGSGPGAPDPGDQFLWDLIAAHEELILVTGDLRLVRAEAMSGRVLDPSRFAEQYLHR